MKHWPLGRITIKDRHRRQHGLHCHHFGKCAEIRFGAACVSLADRISYYDAARRGRPIHEPCRAVRV